MKWERWPWTSREGENIRDEEVWAGGWQLAGPSQVSVTAVVMIALLLSKLSCPHSRLEEPRSNCLNNYPHGDPVHMSASCLLQGLRVEGVFASKVSLSLRRQHS